MVSYSTFFTAQPVQYCHKLFITTVKLAVSLSETPDQRIAYRVHSYLEWYCNSTGEDEDSLLFHTRARLQKMGTAGRSYWKFLCIYDGSRSRHRAMRLDKLAWESVNSGLQISWRLNCQEFQVRNSTMEDFHRNSWLINQVGNCVIWAEFWGDKLQKQLVVCGHVTYGRKQAIYCLRMAGEEIMCLLSQLTRKYY